MRQTRYTGIIGIVALLAATLWGGASGRGGVASAAEPGLVTTPGHVSCTSTMTVHGAGFEPGSEVVVSAGGVDDIPGTVFEAYFGPVTVATDGTFSIDVDPGTMIYECHGGPLGRDGTPYEVTASTVTGVTDPNEGHAFGLPAATSAFTFAVDPSDPRLTLTPDHGAGCMDVTAYGENFEPGTFVSIFTGALGGDNFGLAVDGHPVVGADGTFSVTLAPELTPFITCDGEDLLWDGTRYRVSAMTGRGPKPHDDDWREPSATDVFTVSLSPAERFRQTWADTDERVASGEADRTWVWGPAPLTEVVDEEYADSPGGMRSVQYFDKARMEINQPDGDRRSPWYVTNGLLVVEMVVGYFQIGDAAFDDSPAPADIPIAGDAGSTSLTYAEIDALQLRSQPARAVGTAIDEYIYTDQPDVRSDDAYAAYGVTATHHVPETDHTVASVFWDFMTSEEVVGMPVYEYTRPLFDNPIYSTGLPITEAYWTTTLLDGEAADILWQCFERRCLTYTPGNPEGWQVEAGNVGQHYWQWRYGHEGAE